MMSSLFMLKTLFNAGFQEHKDTIPTFAQLLDWKPHLENLDGGKPLLCFNFFGEHRKRFCFKVFRGQIFYFDVFVTIIKIFT